MEQILKKNIQEALTGSKQIQERFLAFIKNNPNEYFNRQNISGHITSSMFTVSPNNKVLLTHHKKFKQWLQLGGHNDVPGQTPLETAIREMLEEGFGEKDIPYTLLSDKPINIEIHHVKDPILGEHDHYDICFIAQVNDESLIECSHESEDVKWVTFEEILADNELYEERLKVMVKKAIELMC